VLLNHSTHPKSRLCRVERSPSSCRNTAPGHLLLDASPKSSDNGSKYGTRPTEVDGAAIILAEELNFSRAARRLHISQPALTKQVAELESRLGVLVFNRDKQMVSLTDAGRAYVEQARLCVFHSKRAVHTVHTAAREIGSVLSVGRSPYIDPFLISTLLTARLPLFPDLKLELPSRFSLELIHDVLAGTLDLAIGGWHKSINAHIGITAEDKRDLRALQKP
jgi:DNA-binding MarR family transcriptional regulator